MESTTGIQKKIVELDPFGVEVIPDTEGNLHPGNVFRTRPGYR